MLDFKYTYYDDFSDIDVGWDTWKYVKSLISLCRQNKILLLLVRWF